MRLDTVQIALRVHSKTVASKRMAERLPWLLALVTNPADRGVWKQCCG